MSDFRTTMEHLFHTIKTGIRDDPGEREFLAGLAALMDIGICGPIQDMDDLFIRAQRLAEAYSSEPWEALNESKKWDAIDLMERALRVNS